MSDWMDDFDEAKRNETRDRPLMSTCKSCGKVRPVGDDGDCGNCFVKGKDDD